MRLSSLTAALLMYIAWAVAGQYLAAQVHSGIIQAIDQAEEDREASLTAFSTTEIYRVYKSRNDVPIGERIVRTTYIRDKAKTFKELSRSGSSRAQEAIDHIIRAQQELSPEKRRLSLLISSNYKMRLLAANEQPRLKPICGMTSANTPAYILEIRPKAPGPTLVEGFLWVDSRNYHVIRIEGKLSASPSWFVGHAPVERNYADKNGFAMATSFCSITNRWWHPDYTLQITYKDYEFLHSVSQK